MPLPNKHTGMVNRLDHTQLEYKGLEPAFKEVLHSWSQNIIKLVLALIQEPVPVHSTEKDLTLKYPARRTLLIQSEKLPRSITDAAQSILNPPQLSLTSEPIPTHKLQLMIQSYGQRWLFESLHIITHHWPLTTDTLNIIN